MSMLPSRCERTLLVSHRTVSWYSKNDDHSSSRFVLLRLQEEGPTIGSTLGRRSIRLKRGRSGPASQPIFTRRELSPPKHVTTSPSTRFTWSDFTHARTFCHTYTHIHFQSHVLDEITLTMSLTRHGCLSLDEDDDEIRPGRV
jgi:hypothetical protein